MSETKESVKKTLEGTIKSPKGFFKDLKQIQEKLKPGSEIVARVDLYQRLKKTDELFSKLFKRNLDFPKLAKVKELKNPVFYQIEKDGQIFYILGTCHTHSYYNLPKEIQDIIQSCKTIMIENISDEKDLQSLASLKQSREDEKEDPELKEMLDEHRRKLRKQYGDEVLKFSDSALLYLVVIEEEMGNGITEGSIIFKSERRITNLMDCKITNDARKSGRNVIQLESYADRAVDAGFDSLSKKNQFNILSRLFDFVEIRFDKIVKELENKLHDFYQNGLIDEMHKIDMEMDIIRKQKLPIDFQSMESIAKRNQRWFRRILETVNSKEHQEGCAIVVGAGHLPGDKGLLNLFKQNGYKISSYSSMKALTPPPYFKRF